MHGKRIQSQRAYEKRLARMAAQPNIQVLRRYGQHKGSTTYGHVMAVARMSGTIARKLHIPVEERDLMRGALLHDYYLYGEDRQEQMGAYKHGTSHAETAVKNAQRRFDLTPREKNIIWSHMWPLNLTHVPKSREAWIVCAADKICAVQEMVFHRSHKEDTNV